MYELAVGGYREVSPGTSVLVTGAPLSGQHRVVRETVARLPGDEPIVAVGARDCPPRLRRTYDLPAERAGIVDCVSAHVGRGAPATPGTTAVPSPAAVDHIERAVSDWIESFCANNASGALLVDALSTLLLSAPLQAVHDLFAVLTEYVTAVDGLGLVVLDEPAHDPATIRPCRHLFDAVVETAPGEEPRLVDP